MSSRSTDDTAAFRAERRRKAAQEFNEVVRQNTRGWDDAPMNADQQAYADDAIVRAAREFSEQTSEPYDDGMR